MFLLFLRLILLWTNVNLIYYKLCVFFWLDSCLIDKQNMIKLLDDFYIYWLSVRPCKDLMEYK
jgi:hypothetical protein